MRHKYSWGGELTLQNIRVHDFKRLQYPGKQQSNVKATFKSKFLFENKMLYVLLDLHILSEKRAEFLSEATFQTTFRRQFDIFIGKKSHL